MKTDALNELKEHVFQGQSDTNMAVCCCLGLDSCLDSPSRTLKFGIECIADGKLLSKMFKISFSMPWRISVNNLWITDLAAFREWVNNDQRATTTPLSVGVESCSLKYFTDTKFVYRKTVELLVFAWTNTVTHLLQKVSFSQNLNALIIFNFWSASHVYCTSWET